jgi:hypothetical protein
LNAWGNFKPRIDRVFPFAEIVEAHRYMESNEQIGKIAVPRSSDHHVPCVHYIFMTASDYSADTESRAVS